MWGVRNICHPARRELGGDREGPGTRQGWAGAAQQGVVREMRTVLEVTLCGPLGWAGLGKGSGLWAARGDGAGPSCKGDSMSGLHATPQSAGAGAPEALWKQVRQRGP